MLTPLNIYVSFEERMPTYLHEFDEQLFTHVIVATGRVELHSG